MILALDTATRQATVALCDGQQTLAEASREVTTHSEGLLPLIHQVLQQAGVAVHQLRAVACGRGPGSFTGLRIGMATAKGLCMAAGKPLICVSSLLPLGAAAAELAAAQTLVAAVLDARRKELFYCLHRDAQPAGEELLSSPGELVRYLRAEAGDEPLVLAGDGALLYAELLAEELGPQARLAPHSCHQIQARHLAYAACARLDQGAEDQLYTAEPRYIRASDARLPRIPQGNRGSGIRE